MPGPQTPQRVLHLFANHKITGPAELALETARALLGQGVPASFYSSDVVKTKYRDRWLQQLAREREVPEPELSRVRLPKHFSPFGAAFDVPRLARFLAQERPDVVHCHLPNDHLLTWAALRWAKLEIPVVRSYYDAEAPAPDWRSRRTLGSVARVVCFSEAAARELRQRAPEFGLDPTAVRRIDPPIDTTRFDPARGVPPRRQALGVPADAFCLGIVARMQTHRRFELLLEAMQRLQQGGVDAHLVVVGRGTNQESVARGPVRELGLSDLVHFSGYISGEDYVGTLASFDAKLYLVPGSDGTCRAVREALAMGLPVIATRRGMLPELVRDGVDGVLVDETVDSLAGAIQRVAAGVDERRAMSRAARDGAVERFSFDVFAGALKELYEELVGVQAS